MNGKTIDMSAYAYKAPEKAMGLRDIRKFDPANYVPPAKDAKADTPASIPVSFGLTWKGAEIWSLTLTSEATVKFFDPLNGIFAESPEALPRRKCHILPLK